MHILLLENFFFSPSLEFVDVFNVVLNFKVKKVG